jgi:hypothetical protein
MMQILEVNQIELMSPSVEPFNCSFKHPFKLNFREADIKIHRTIILPVVLYGCETWSLTVRKEHRLRALRRVFGPKRDEVMGMEKVT